MKKVLTLLLLVSSICLFAEDVSIKPAGEGTEESPYLFDCLENFFWLRQNVLEMDPDVPIYCKQVKDIDASATQQGGDYAWQTIEFNKHVFAYDGQCYTIYGLEPEEKGALFGTGYLQLKNIRIQGAEGIKTCALAKNLYSLENKKGYFENCRIKGLLVGTPALAEYVAGKDVTVNGCAVEADIEGLRVSGALIGFLRGTGTCSFKKNSFKGKIVVGDPTIISGMLLYLDIFLSNTEIYIEDCYSDFDVTIVPESECLFAGLLVNVHPFDNITNSTVNIERCYVSGEVSGSLIVNNKAFVWGDAITNCIFNVRDCYYNESINFPDDYAVGKTDEEMKQQATFENWDFENVWDIDEGETMPYFISELPEPCGMLVLLLLPLFLRRNKN